MADDKKIEVGFGVQLKELNEGMAKATSAIKEGTHAIESHFDGMKQTFQNVLAPLALVGLEAGAVLEGIKKAVEFAAESFHHFMESAEIMAKLHYETGETYQSLNEMGIALKMTGGDISQLEGWMKGSARAVKANRVAIEEHGGAAVKAALATGTFKDYLVAVDKKSQEFRPGLARNAYLMEALGRAGVQSGHQIHLAAEAMDEAKEIAKSYGITLGKDDVEAMEELHKQTGKMSVAWDMMQVQIGRELMPAIKELATWLASNLPKAMEIFGNIIRGVRVLVLGVTSQMDEARIVGGAVWGILSAHARAYYDVLRNPMDVIGISKRLAQETTAVWQNAMISQTVLMAETAAKMHEIGNASFGASEDEAGPKKKDFSSGKSKETDEAFRAAEVRLKLEEETTARLLHEKGQFYEKSYQYEVDFWAKALKEESLNTKETELMQKKLTDAKQASYKEDLTAKKAALDSEIGDEKRNLQNKLVLTQREAEMYAEGTKGRIDAERKVQAVQREIRDQEHALAVIDKEFKVFMAKDEADERLKHLKFRQEMGELTAKEEIALERSTIARKFDLDIQYTRDVLLLEAKTEEEKAKIQNKVLELQAQKARAMADSDRVRMTQQMGQWKTLASSITSVMSQTTKGLINGTMSWADAFRNVMRGVLNSFVDMGVKMAEDWAMRKALMLMKTLIFGAQETAANDAVAANNATVGVASDKALAVSAAGLAAVNAMASVAAIPFYGWAMAGPVGAETLATALGLASAEGGWNRVPNDTIAMLHKDEKVLPARYAQKLDAMLEGGGGSQGGTTNITYRIQAIDSKDAARFIRQNGGKLASQVQKQARNFQGMGR